MSKLAAVVVVALALAGSAGAAKPKPSSLIVFSGTGQGFQIPQLYSISPSGTGLRQVTNGSLSALYPAWSPNGQRIAFTRSGVGIFTIDPDGGRLKRITTNGRDSYPTWSPDGTRIAFVRPLGTKFRVFIVKTNGGTPRELKQAPPAGRTVWTKRGLYITSGGDLIKIDQTSGRVLGYVGANIDAIWGLNSVTVASDMSRLTYVGSRAPIPGDMECGEGPCQRFGLYLESLTSKRKQGVLIVKDAGAAAFSPDGRQIVYAVNGELDVRSATSSATRALATGAITPTTGSAPTWR